MSKPNSTTSNTPTLALEVGCEVKTVANGNGPESRRTYRVTEIKSGKVTGMVERWHGANGAGPLTEGSGTVRYPEPGARVEVIRSASDARKVGDIPRKASKATASE